MDQSELEEALDQWACPKCGAEIAEVDPPDVEIECVRCMWEETTNWRDASDSLFFGCPHCRDNGIKSPVFVVGSFAYEVALFTEFGENTIVEVPTHRGRPDYWEFVIHFCTRDALLSIVRAGRIEANATGYYGKLGAKAVCLSDVPLGAAKGMREAHGEFGLAFRKKDVLAYGGQPVLYLTDTLIQAQKSAGGFDQALRPFVNLIRTPATAPQGKIPNKVDFLHEREWRVPRDIVLKDLAPVGLVMPENDPIQGFTGPKWKMLMRNASKYKIVVPKKTH